LRDGRAALDAAWEKVHESEQHDVAVVTYVLPALEVVRGSVDALEQIVADGLWPLPKYREMLFLF
ncbi:MAG TPA: hypothetical protein PKA64_21050, partial [Myxococcota bacterium]|nr:hypothetical protein [Myxococcota bacterium]